jgi:flagellar biosynthesis/type III secretory pathway M-ring protein FliF/YscJ
MNDEKGQNESCSRSSPARGSQQNDVAFALLATAAFVVFVVVAGVVAVVVPFPAEHDAEIKRYQEEEIARQIAEVKAGRANFIYLYCSEGTDGLLEQLVNVPGIEDVRLDLTDVTDDGMKSLAKLKNLRSLSVCGGRASAAVFKKFREALPNCAVSTERVAR